jgi:Raf kinase inhibitor-like YbhB/YbcL family protein
LFADIASGETGVSAMLRLAGVIVLAFSLALGVVDAAGAAEPHFTLASSAFNDNPPAGTKSFAVLMIDPDGRRGIGSVHWVAYGIPATRNGLREGEGATQTADVTLGRNSRGTMGYTGPCGPPVDAAHHYVIDVIALDLEPTTLQPGLDRDQLLNLITGHSLGPASIVVRYRSEQ